MSKKRGIDVNNFEYQFFDPRFSTNSSSPVLRNAFSNWYEIWKTAYKLYWDSEEIFADQFTRQTFQGVLTYGGEFVASLAFDFKDLNLPESRHDSYFRMWTDISYEKLKAQSSNGKILVCSWFTVSPSWRKTVRGIDTKKLVLGCAVKSFEFLGGEVMCGTLVHVGESHKICYELNAKPILKNTTEKGLPIDLLYWSYADIKKMSYPFYEDILSNIFNEDRELIAA